MFTYLFKKSLFRGPHVNMAAVLMCKHISAKKLGGDSPKKATELDRGFRTTPFFAHDCSLTLDPRMYSVVNSVLCGPHLLIPSKWFGQNLTIGTDLYSVSKPC